MGSDDEFGPQTATIRAWLEKRATYATDREVPLPDIPARGVSAAPSPEPRSAPPAAAAPPSHLPSTHEAGRALVDMLGPTFTEEDEETAAAEEPQVVVPPEPQAPAPASEPTRVARRAPTPAAPAVAVHGGWREAESEDLPPAVIEFKPRTRVRRTISLILVLALAATVAAAIWAARERTAIALGVTATLGLLVLVVWAVRASTTPTRLTIRRGQLEIVRNGRRSTIDLASPYTPVAVVGSSDRRGWQVLIERLDAPVLVLTSGDVDPEPFMRVLLRLRPDLRPGAQPLPSAS